MQIVCEGCGKNRASRRVSFPIVVPGLMSVADATMNLCLGCSDQAWDIEGVIDLPIYVR